MERKTGLFVIMLAAALASGAVSQDSGGKTGLAKAREGFSTTLTVESEKDVAPEEPPAELFDRVKYPSAVGDLWAYVGKEPQPGRKHPAIIWLVGGFGNSIDGFAWEEMEADNDQSAAQFREAGVVMMYPSLRGGNDNPGSQEAFFGEVDDVIAAAEYLAKVPHVDPDRIYLGGHSTGGTLALLVAASTGKFRAVFAYGPTDTIDGYPEEYLPFDLDNEQEVRLRSPIHFVNSITSPTFVIEGLDGNYDVLKAIRARAGAAPVHCTLLLEHDHFSDLAPGNAMIARKILADTGPTSNIHVSGLDFWKLR